MKLYLPGTLEFVFPGLNAGIYRGENEAWGPSAGFTLIKHPWGNFQGVEGLAKGTNKDMTILLKMGFEPETF